MTLGRHNVVITDCDRPVAGMEHNTLLHTVLSPKIYFFTYVHCGVYYYRVFTEIICRIVPVVFMPYFDALCTLHSSLLLTHTHTHTHSCHSHTESLFSSRSGFQNYRGLLNDCILLLVRQLCLCGDGRNLEAKFYLAEKTVVN